MNTERREALQKAREKLGEVKELFVQIQNDEQEAFDNLPESLQSASQGEVLSSNVAVLEEVVSYLESADSEAEGIE